MKRVEIKKVKGCRAAVMIRGKGPYDEVGPVFGEIYQWIEKEGYKCTGAGREVYLNCPDDTPEEKLLTEIQVPVKKI